MKRRDILKSAPLAAAVFSCSGADDNPVAENSAANTTAANDTATVMAEKTAGFRLKFQPNYADNDVVIIDDDNWIIELAHVRTRRHTLVYKGLLRYLNNNIIVKGDAYGVYYSINNIILLNCIDVGWDNTLISYSFGMDDTQIMKGVYCYMVVKRAGFIEGKILKSNIPGHEVAAPTSKIAVPNEDGPVIHPKLGGVG